MTDYTITTNFGAKDSLPSGNAGKVIKGEEFTTEFTNIQTAVNTKADTAGDTFTGVVNFSADVAVNTNTLFVDVSEAKVGIGTSSPDHLLCLQGAEPTLRIFDTANTLNQEQTISFGTEPGDRTQSEIASINLNTGNAEGALSFKTNSGASLVERMRIDSSGNVGIGTTSPDTVLDIREATPTLRLEDNQGGNKRLELSISNDAVGRIKANQSASQLAFETSGAERLRIDSSGNVGIGTTSFPSTEAVLTLSGTGASTAMYFGGGSDYNFIRSIREANNVHHMTFGYKYSDSSDVERMRIDSSGNLLVGKTAAGIGTVGIEATGTGNMNLTASGSEVLNANRLSTDGNLFRFFKDGTTVGNIGTVGGDMYLVTGARGIHISDGANSIVPCNATGGDSDATTSLGLAGARFKDLYRSGSTYSTSDRNKKQDIRDLTDAEARVAVVAKGSLKAFRYIDTVEAEGDDANIHFGIIAQDLKAAFEAEGLNADNYQVLKTSTYIDDDDVEQTTYSVCYENLLAFIISAI